jgi:hypothetical protein
MEQRIIQPKDYHLILITQPPQNSFKIRNTIERYRAEERVPDVLLAPSKNYEGGLLVLDGNIRVVASGRIKRGIESYVCNSDDDRAGINRLMSEMKLVTGASLLRNFLMEIYSFDELVLKGEKLYEENGKVNLRKYLKEY